MGKIDYNIMTDSMIANEVIENTDDILPPLFEDLEVTEEIGIPPMTAYDMYFKIT